MHFLASLFIFYNMRYTAREKPKNIQIFLREGRKDGRKNLDYEGLANISLRWLRPSCNYG